MKCKEIQELIMTDYLDGELSREHQLMIDDHLGHCPECRKTAQSAKSLSRDFAPLKDANLDREVIWQNIKNALEEDRASSVIYSPGSGSPSLLENLFKRFKPSFVFATMAVLLIMFSVFVVQERTKMAQLTPEEKIEYLAYLEDEAALDGNAEDILDEDQLAIEAYFL